MHGKLTKSLSPNCKYLKAFRVSQTFLGIQGIRNRRVKIKQDDRFVPTILLLSPLSPLPATSSLTNTNDTINIRCC